LSPTGFDLEPDDMGRYLGDFARGSLVNIAGGCCGNTPEHIAAIARALRDVPPRPLTPRAEAAPEPLRLSGSLPFTQQPGVFMMIGERTNVAGSPKFARLIKEGKFEEAVAIARQQVDSGANVIDVCMDEGMIDGVAAMSGSCRCCASEPEVAKVPFMIDSSKWEVIEAGLKCLQGKGIVNSISLKEGEERFRACAREVLRYGAAVVVMAFDEQGQAATFDDKIRICARAYASSWRRASPAGHHLRPQRAHRRHGHRGAQQLRRGLHRGHALDQGQPPARQGQRRHLQRVVQLPRQQPRARGDALGVPVPRDRAGLDMGIVNAGMLEVYEEIDPELRDLVEDVLLNRRPDATERLVEHGERLKAEGAGASADRKVEEEAWRKGTVEERITHALVKGIDTFIDEDTEEARQKLGRPSRSSRAR
jgi:5-methyltetrahydrofolate--homocysteine methyltransferase